MSPSVLGGSHLSVFETAEDKDLAFAFVKLMTTGEFATKWGEQAGYFPGQTSLLDETLESTDRWWPPRSRSSSSRAARPCRCRRTSGAVQAKLTTSTMMQSILSGSEDVATASTKAADEMTSLLNGGS